MIRTHLLPASVLSIFTLIPNIGSAMNLHWSGNGTTQGGAGTWDTTSSRWGTAVTGPYQLNWNNANNDTAKFGGIAAGTVTLAAGTSVGGMQFDTAGYIVTGNTITFGTAGSLVANKDATVSSVLAGGSLITKSGAGTLTLNASAANTFNAGLHLKGGTLLADLSNLTTPANAIPSGNAIALGGGALGLKGKSTGTSSQTFNNITVNAGGGQILGNKNGGSALNIALGSITASASGGSLLLGNATTSTGNAPVITTTTNKNGTGIHGGRMVFFTGAANTGYDWASTASGSSPYTLSAYNSYTTLPTSGGLGTVNYNATASTTLTSGFSVNTLKFAPGSTASQTIDLGGGTVTLDGGGLLITGTGASSRISNGTLTAGNGSGSYDFIVHQFNNAGGILNGNYSTNTTLSTAITDNGGNAVSLVKGGSGSLVLNGTVSYTGKTYINGGYLILGCNNAGGALGNGNYAGEISIAAGANLCVYMTTTAQTLSGVISGEGGLIKAFNGPLALSDNNTYTGKTWLNAITTNGGGTTTVTSLNSVNGGNPPLAASSFGRPTTVENGTIDIGGTAQGGVTLKYSGPGETTDRVINFIFNGNGATKTLDSSGTGFLKFTSTFTSNASLNNDFTLTGTGGGEIVGGLPFTNAKFTKSGSGTWIVGDSINTSQSTGTTSISAGTLVMRKGGFGSPGAMTVSANAALVYNASTDTPLAIAGPLAITGGTSTTLGASIGSTTDSAVIEVTGNATSSSTVKLNLYGNSFSTVGQGSDTYTLIRGNGTNTLNAATYSLNTVFNATNFTVGAINKSPDTVTADITQVPALATAFWKGTATANLTKVWAASNGAGDSNWSSTIGGSVQSLVPGADTDVIVSSSSPAVAPTNTKLGADMSIKSLTIADTTNGMSLIASVYDGYGLTLGAGGITMNAGVPASSIAVPVILGGNQTWTNSSANALTIDGPVQGSGHLTKTGGGTINLTGFNSFTGNITVNSGMLSFGKPTLPSNAIVTIASGATLQLDYTGTTPVAYLIVNGVSLPAGTYNSSNQAPYLSGTGSLTVTITDTDVDGIPDWWMTQNFGHPTGQSGDMSRAQDDADNDGLDNLGEYQNGTNPKLADTDTDGLNDGPEIATHLTNPLLPDTDGDGLSDGAEVNTHATSPLLADTDSDSLSDGAEINTHTTNPLTGDTDSDGVGDWYEITATFTDPKLSSSKPNVIYPLPKPDNTPTATNKPVKVFILMGQSNMEGKGNINSIGTPGTLATVVRQQSKFPNLLDTNGNWSVRADVKYRGVISAIGNAGLGVGQGTNSTLIGPELAFGHLMGHHLDEPVIVIKASLGGQDLAYDFMSPGSQRYTVSGKTYAGYLDTARSWTEGATPPPQYVPGTPTGYLGNPVGGASNYGGKMFDDSVSQVNGILNDFANQYPQYAAQGYQIAGIGWFQGYNDSLNSIYYNRYEANMVNFINAFRNAVGAPDAPFVIAGCAFDGWAAAGGQLAVINAQLAVGNQSLHPEFNGKVKTMECRSYWRTVAQSPVSEGYHYNRNSETYLLVGDAIARGMLELLPATPPANSYANWIAGYPSVPPGLAGFAQDVDGDGIENGVENFFGTNPGVGTAGLVAGASSGNTFTFTHPQNATPATGVTAAYRWSKDLATFRNGGQTDGDGTTVNFNANTNAGITTVTATVTGTPAAKLFVDVKVMQN
jgi:autotransporter-associated beta strand protein